MRKRDKNTEGLVNVVEFGSQHLFPITGAVACTSISMAMCARLLPYSNEELLRLFVPGSEKKVSKASIQILNSCVEAGISLNREISTGFFGFLHKKSTKECEDGIEELTENFAGSKNLHHLIDDTAIGLTDKASGVLETLDDFYDHATTNRTDGLKASDLWFIMTAAGHTTSFFTKTGTDDNDYFYIIDSLTSITKGKMYIFDNIDSAFTLLKRMWKKNIQADITVYTLKETLKSLKETLESKEALEPTKGARN